MTFFCSQLPPAFRHKKIQGESITDAIIDRIIHEYNPIEIKEDSGDDHSMGEINGNNDTKNVMVFCARLLALAIGLMALVRRTGGSRQSDRWLY